MIKCFVMYKSPVFSRQRPHGLSINFTKNLLFSAIFWARLEPILAKRIVLVLVAARNIHVQWNSTLFLQSEWHFSCNFFLAPLIFATSLRFIFLKQLLLLTKWAFKNSDLSASIQRLRGIPAIEINDIPVLNYLRNITKYHWMVTKLA